MNKKLQVEIFGRRYTLQGNSDQAYAQELASYVGQKMQEISEHSHGSPFSKLAILSAINITHELFQLKHHQKKSDSAIAGKTRRMIETIEEQFEMVDERI